MRRLVPVGIILVVLGALVLAHPAVPYKDRSKVIDIGGVEVTTETDKTLRIPPLVGGVTIAGGILLVLGGRS